MLPTKAYQLDYMDLEFLVNSHIKSIEEFEEKKNIKFNFVIGKLRNGVFPASIIANHLDIPMFFMNAQRFNQYKDYELIFYKEYEDLLKNNTNVLIVDSICGTGETMQNMTSYLKEKFPNMNVYSYATLTDNRSKFKPSIDGHKSDLFFQPPWELRSFTPEAHLDRIEYNHIKSSKENSYYMGFCSEDCKDDIEFTFNQKISGQWVDVFDVLSYQKQLNSSSGISALKVEDFKSLSFSELNGKASDYIKFQVHYILTSGFTHYVTDNLNAALLISKDCKTTNILYFDGKKIHKIKSNEVDFKDLIKLNF